MGACLRLPQRARGFTLVELVTVILILGVVVVGVSGFIIFGTRIFVDSSAVDQALSQSRFALERMTRELRGALPNSLRLSTGFTNAQCLEFVPVLASTSYIDMPIVPQAASGGGSAILDTLPTAVAAGQWAYIYPLTETEVYGASPVSTTTPAKRALVSAVSVAGSQLSLSFNPEIRFTEASPRQRMYFSQNAVSYCFEGNPLVLKRYSGYGLKPSQAAPAAMGAGVLMAENIVNNLADNTDLPVSLTPSTLVNNAMVQLQPRFTVVGETFQYRHQVQVINVP
jgi:MSHA biogenesis protein MshO